ncbi:ATP-dependent DNA helicase [Enterococcus dongliensis]|uniref:DNA 5'-3' helicase n=1 Tax=Enterococcus dongliensis TaxID=2559925 RepID=A0ABU3EM80_9ENTE|nr:ATP-dependent DNA helicase [Enterococcus dongliensis]MDT2595950.1 ATP-dependent DNA helicase [Enterococcus dongliensis]MDT2602789.1 ATP-dependent DNA helicase [Enterococcus dongliensis]MDT2639561.1 ATP-dependent DNA helicase [Enterococcus dongliensis]MDT2643974.1 ATP-dependent DNA helicase [Enterococcus dongliensis]MDT2647008.1 ATP-dependent DNA helicase [Enterococcus dongliensis]
MAVKKLAIRELVEFILRSGSINEGKSSNHTPQEGARIHRKLQKEAGPDYQKEVWLKKVLEIAETTVQIEGRADGIYRKEDQVFIDEIKTSETPFEELEPGIINLYFYQAMVYAYIYSEQEELTEISTRLTYFQTTEEKITREIRVFTFVELTDFFNDLIERYENWLVFQIQWRKTRNDSLKSLTFPFDSYRAGQRELAAAVYKTIHAQQKLFVEAPTGTGKTMSTLFPTFKAMGEELGERIFYLTAKTITRQVAEETVTKLTKKGARIKSVTITAKDKICFLTERNCTPEHCPFAKGYYDRVNDGLWDMLNNEDQYTRPVIEKYAQKHELCPFELSLDVSRFCDLVIGDYNYLFDPTVYLRRFFEEEDKTNLVLVDEAHNLVNRSKEMYSASISRETIARIQKDLDKTFRKLIKAFKKVDNEFELILQSLDGKAYHHQQMAPDSLINSLFKLQEQIKEWLAEYPDHPVQQKMLPIYFEILRFTRMSEYYDDHYQTTVEHKRYDLIVKEFCIDPSWFLEQTMEKVGSSILFSASFSPLDYYQEVLGGGEESLSYRLPNPFPAKNRLVMVDASIQTTYQKRTQSIPKIVSSIEALVRSKTGNYLVFFPSFQYLDQVAAYFHEVYPEITIQIQGTKLSEVEREAFLASFDERPEKTMIGFCVLGGIFSEGIDLVGDRLIGTIVVGVGLPQINHEQELIKEYYDEKQNRGFSYAYQLPGMNKVIQAAGRVIRTMSDRGIILLLDQRYTNPHYQNLLPINWSDRKVVYNSEDINKTANDFWQNNR